MDLVEARKECVSKHGRRQVLPKNLREAANRKCRRRTVGRQHVNDGVLTIDQSKTEGGEEAHLEIPLHPKLKEIIDATPEIRNNGLGTGLLTQIPYSTEQGIILAEQGILTREQGVLPTRAEVIVG